MTEHNTKNPSQRPLFRQQISAQPQLDAQYWCFMLGGRVEIPLMLSFQDLCRLPAVEFDAVLACAGTSAGGKGIAQAHWRGVALETILAEVTPLQGANFAHLHAADGYTSCLTVDQLKSAALVYAMNGSDLPATQGYPVRLMVPGLYGYKMPKWIQRIVLADEALPGFWEQRGWPQQGTVAPTAAFTAPQNQAALTGSVQLQGFAYADQPIASVELRVDGGPWMPAAHTQETTFSMAHWAIQWTPTQPGSYRLQVRARDLSGSIQPEPYHSMVLHLD